METMLSLVLAIVGTTSLIMLLVVLPICGIVHWIKK